jgi:hypothetical protein
MITIPFAVMILGLAIWFIFSKSNFSDPLVAEAGFAGLLVVLLGATARVFVLKDF